MAKSAQTAAALNSIPSHHRPFACIRFYSVLDLWQQLPLTPYMFSSPGWFIVNREPPFKDSDRIVSADVALHQVMLINALQDCHITGDKAAQLCSGQQHGQGCTLAQVSV